MGLRTVCQCGSVWWIRATEQEVKRTACRDKQLASLRSCPDCEPDRYSLKEEEIRGDTSTRRRQRVGHAGGAV